MAKLFLSYARGDDEPFVQRLHSDLVKQGFDVWFDRVSMPSRQLTFHQEIKDTILARDRVIYVAGPKAAISDYVREEWQFALELDKPVIPILRKGDFDLVPGALCLMHCDDFRNDDHYPHQLAKLIANLRRPEPPLGKLLAVPNLPSHFLGRPNLLRKLKDAVLVDLQIPVVVTGAASRVGLQGMGGIGKSVLAAAVARDREVRRSYPDGIVWIPVGPKPDIVQLMRDLAHILGSTEIIGSEIQGQSVLRRFLLDKSVFIVFDDIWQARDAMTFDVLGPRCRALVTTRDAGILHTLQGQLYCVELFTESEALQLLASATGVALQFLPHEAIEIVRKCGCLPLAVALCAGMAKRNLPWSHILRRLHQANLEKISDRQAINPQHENIWCAMQVSVDALPPDQQRRFAELAVFATDQTVPQAAVATLWEHTGSLDELDVDELLVNLAERSLIRLDAPAGAEQASSRRISLHNLLHDYAIRIAGDQRTLHRALLDAYWTKCPADWPTAPDDGYFLQNARTHFVFAAREDDWISLLLNLRWAEAKVMAGLAHDLVSDYASAPSKGLDSNKTKIQLIQQLRLAASQEVHNLSQAKSTSRESTPAFVQQQLRNRVFSNSRGRFDLATTSPGDWSGAILHQRPLRPALFSRRIALDPDSTTYRTLGSVKFTSDGRLLIAAIGRNRVGRIVPDTGLELEPLTSFGRAIAIDFSLDGSLLVLGGDLRPNSDGGFVQAFDLATGKSLSVREMPGPVIKLVVTRDNRVLTSGCPLVHVLSLPELEQLQTLDPFDKGTTFSIAVDRSRALVALGEFHDKEEPARIKVYDATTLDQKAEITGPKYGVTSLAFSDLPGILASGSIHLPNGVVAWQWQLPGSKYDQSLLSPKEHDLACNLIATEGYREHARLGRIISTLRTDDTIGGLSFYPGSSRLIAVEGSLNRTTDNIYVFEVFGDKPGDVPRLSGHTSFPIGVDIDPAGQFAATVHAKGEVYIWPAQDIEHLKPANRHAQVTTPSADAMGKFILACGGDYRSIRILDTEKEQELPSSSMRPSHAASISPSGDWFVRFYWKQLPMNPYGEYEGEETEAWFKAFREQTPVCGYIHPVSPSEDKVLAWQLMPNVSVHHITFDPTGQSGAALLSHESGRSVCWFSPSREASSHFEVPSSFKPFALHMPSPRELLVFSEVNGEVVAHAARLSDGDEWSIRTEFRDFGPRKEITCGPIPLGGDLFALVRNDCLVEIQAIRQSDLAANLSTKTALVSTIASTESKYAIFDIASAFPRHQLILTNSYPALAVYTVPHLQLRAWRPLDQACRWVFPAKNGKLALAIGPMPEITGIHYSMMSMPE